MTETVAPNKLTNNEVAKVMFERQCVRKIETMVKISRD